MNRPELRGIAVRRSDLRIPVHGVSGGRSSSLTTPPAFRRRYIRRRGGVAANQPAAATLETYPAGSGEVAERRPRDGTRRVDASERAELGQGGPELAQDGRRSGRV